MEFSNGSDREIAGKRDPEGSPRGVQRYFEIFDNRLVESPKNYFVDSALVCRLLGIRSLAAQQAYAFLT